MVLNIEGPGLGIEWLLVLRVGGVGCRDLWDAQVLLELPPHFVFLRERETERERGREGERERGREGERERGRERHGGRGPHFELCILGRRISSSCRALDFTWDHSECGGTPEPEARQAIECHLGGEVGVSPPLWGYNLVHLTARAGVPL